MKTKNAYAFGLRWMGVASLHALLFTTFWMSNAWIFTQWYSTFSVNLISGIALALLRYWAMSPMMRPSPKRWLLASVLGQLVSVSLHALVFYNLGYSSFVNDNLLLFQVLIASTLFVPQAISQSWALAERFKKAWLFGLSFCLPAVMFLGQVTVYEQYEIFLQEIGLWLIHALLLGISLSYLQKYQLKETVALNQSYERLERQDEQEALVADESITLAQQKLG